MSNANRTENPHTCRSCGGGNLMNWKLLTRLPEGAFFCVECKYTWIPTELDHKTSNPWSDFRDWLIAQRNEYALLIEQGKGTWPEKDYVRDDTWNYWQGALAKLEQAVRRLPDETAARIPPREFDIESHTGHYTEPPEETSATHPGFCEAGRHTFLPGGSNCIRCGIAENGSDG